MAQIAGKALAGGFFLLAVLFYLLKGSRAKACLYPATLLLAFLGMAGVALSSEPLQVLAASFSLAILLGKRDAFGFSALALAGSLVLFFFSPEPAYFLSAWLLVDLFLLGWGDPSGLPGHLFSQGAGILAFAGWARTGFAPLLFLAASARAGFFPWPRSSPGVRRLAFLQTIMAFYLLKDATLPGGAWNWALALWLALGSGFELTEREGFPQVLWGLALALTSFGKWGIGLLALTFAAAALKGRTAALWKRLEPLPGRLRKWAWNAGEFFDGEGGWLWVGLGCIALLMSMGAEKAGTPQGLIWRDLFPEGFGLMSASLYLLVANSEPAILFSLLAQYIMAAFYRTSPFPGNWLIPARALLGAMVCFILYLSRWGASWIRSPQAPAQPHQGSWWLLRALLGIGGGLLAFLAAGRYQLLSPVPEERLVFVWLTIMGMLGTLAPGTVFQRAAGVLTFLNGFELAGIAPRPLVWFAHLVAAMAASFLSAYEKAGGK